jgi:hypothetical protein
MSLQKNFTIIWFLILSFPALCLLTACSDSGSPEISTDSFHVSGHILQGYVIYSIAFDERGTAWLGTAYKGLVKYEDNKATIFNSQNSNFPDSIIIFDITTDTKNNIWMASGLGLIKYDQNKFTLYNKSNSGMPEDLATAIDIDEDDNLWIASCRFKSGGLMEFNGKNWTLYTPENSHLPANIIRDIQIDNKDNKWLAISETVRESSIIKISGKKWEVYNKSNMGFTPYYFRDLASDKFGNVYASLDYGFSSSINVSLPNIIKFDGSSWSIINPVDDLNRSLGYVSTINTDKFGNLWAGIFSIPHSVSNKDFLLAVYDGDKWFHSGDDFPNDGILVIQTDKNNRKWIGTLNGVYIIN